MSISDQDREKWHVVAAAALGTSTSSWALVEMFDFLADVEGDEVEHNLSLLGVEICPACGWWNDDGDDDGMCDDCLADERRFEEDEEEDDCA